MLCFKLQYSNTVHERDVIHITAMIVQFGIIENGIIGRLLSVINDGRCTCEIKSSTAMAKAAFNKKRAHFTNDVDLKLRKKLVKCCV
jgi:hypothetical protein